MNQITTLDADVLSTLSDDELLHEIHLILADVVPHQITEISMQSSFSDDLGIDSLGAFELIMNAQDRFGIKITDGQMENIKTVKDLFCLIK